MASRNPVAVFHQQRGGAAAVPPMGKQQKASMAEGNNRRALGDIGNVVKPRVGAAEGKPLPQISRPVTRSFGAQLLRNAQLAAEAAAAKKPVKLDVVDGGAVGKGGAKAKPKPVVKPKPEEIIEISPDTRSKSNSRKKKHSLTSVLTARSKAACGITDKPKEIVDDIDGPDAGDQLAVVEYVEDIYSFYRLAENVNRPHDYMDSQVEINAKMRAILADWLIEVHHKFELMPETLYLTFYIIDKFLSLQVVVRRELQLVGVSAMLIACKYEEIWAPEVNDFICISDRAYSREQILAMEKEILNKLEWNLTVPTPYVFLARFIKAALSDKEMEHMVSFFAELGMIQYSMISYSPSMLAASAVYAARCTLNKSPLWTETLRCHTGFSEPQLQECTKLLVNSHSAAGESKLKVVYRKYSSPQRGAVALQPPAAKFLESLNVSST